MIKLARDAGFQQATRVDTDGKRGVYATLNTGARTTVADISASLAASESRREYRGR